MAPTPPEGRTRKPRGMDVSESDLCAGTLAPAEALAEQLLKASSSLKTPRRASRMAQVQIAVLRARERASEGLRVPFMGKKSF